MYVCISSNATSNHHHTFLWVRNTSGAMTAKCKRNRWLRPVTNSESFVRRTNNYMRNIFGI